ncbi:MAG: hypothetical protein PUC21_07030 [Bacteroidales bacterium]|nr:hypothetical protein [Bacteroidales bacterium]MDY5118513.1 hypothetical protein [Muribaculaceae bacterium]
MSHSEFTTATRTADQAQRSVRSLRAAKQRTAPPPKAETMTQGEHFSHPGRWWQPCVAGYFADRGVGDMPGAPSAHI